MKICALKIRSSKSIQKCVLSFIIYVFWYCLIEIEL